VVLRATSLNAMRSTNTHYIRKKVLVENGFAFLGVPEEYGGTEIDSLTNCMVIEEYCKHGAPVYHSTSALRIDDMMMFGSEEQKTADHGRSQRGTCSFCFGDQ